MPPSASPPENTSHLPARFRGLWLAGAGVATLLVLSLASRWAYDHIPGVHYRVRVAWAWAYDRVIPPSDALPTPVNTPQQIALATFAVPSATPTAAPSATAVPAVAVEAAISPTPSAAPSATPVPPTPTAVPGVVLLS